VVALSLQTARTADFRVRRRRDRSPPRRDSIFSEDGNDDCGCGLTDERCRNQSGRLG
jgi:hypothetical protein